MQLILDSEAVLAIEKNMSVVEDNQTEKVGNGNITQLDENNCNGNKENIGEINLISNDNDVNKQVKNEEEVDSLADLPDIKSKCNEVEANIVDTIKEKIGEENSPKTNDAQKESQINGIDEEVSSINVRQKETENKLEETTQEDFVEDEEDIISLKEENLNQLLDIVEKESENDILENNKTAIEEELPGTKDNVQDIEEKTEIYKTREPVKDVELEENANKTELSEIKDKQLDNSKTVCETQNCEDKRLNDNRIVCETLDCEDKELGDSKNVCETLDCEDKELDDSKNDCEMRDCEDKQFNDSKKVCETLDCEEKELDDNKNVCETQDCVDKKIDDSKNVCEMLDCEDKELDDSKNVCKTQECEDKPLDDSKNVSETQDCEDKQLKDSKNVCGTQDCENKQLDDRKNVCETQDCEEKQLKDSKNVSETQDCEDKQLKDSNNVCETLDCDSLEIITSNDAQDSSPIELKDDMDVEEVVEETKSNKQDTVSQTKNTPSASVNITIDKPILKLSNTLDILSDDEEDPPKEDQIMAVDTNEKQCINIEDDDDIMLIDEDTNKTEPPKTVDVSNKESAPINAEDKTDSETGEKTDKIEETSDLFAKPEEKDSTPPAEVNDTSLQINIGDKQEEKGIEKLDLEKPLLPDNFLKTAKKNLSDMTRDDLEEFCILKIVESIVDRSNLSEIKNKLKTMAQGIEEYRKKAMMLTKQNRDLQVVLKSVQEEQKKMTPDTPITPLKITRSVGMQVFMEKSGARRKSLAQLQNTNTNTNNVTNRPNVKNATIPSPRPQKLPANNQAIPVPRLVPANSPAVKTPSTVPLVNQIATSKAASPMPNGIIKTPSPTQKVAEKRQHNRSISVTVDLTDDEPPAKINNRTSPAPPPVRLVPSHNLMANPRTPFSTAVSSPRKVYIPISGPQGQNIRPGQTIMLKTVPPPGIRQRCPTPNTQVARVPTGPIRMNRIQTGRHPAPLPDAMKQYQPPNWKALPPAPDLKLSKVENGIVISWKIEGYQEDSYEEIASYQLYAYQETSSPPSTALWKKIGDVKALPLPMACTLTQFMAGFKYYFAVRAVDIRSRLGPFSLPGSILLLNKL